MKYKINKISLLLISIFIISSCNETDEIGYADVGAEPILKTTNISSFDVNQTIDIEYILKDGVTINSATYNDSNVSDIALTVNGNNASFNTDVKDILDEEFNIITMLSNGVVSRKSMQLSVHSPISVSGEAFEIQEDVAIDEAIVFSNKVSSATIDNITTYWKKGENGTFAAATSGDLVLDLATISSKDSLDLRTFNYTAAPYNMVKRDTLILMTISESGVLKDTVNTKFIFSPQSFVKYSASKTLESDNAINLMNAGTTNPDLYFNVATDSLLIMNDKFKYVDISNEPDAYKDDLLTVEDYVEVYDKYAAGTETTDALLTTNLNRGDLFIYTVERVVKDEDDNDETVTHYGLLSIVSITETNVDGVVTKAIEISSKEGDGVIE